MNGICVFIFFSFPSPKFEICVRNACCTGVHCLMFFIRNFLFGWTLCGNGTHTQFTSCRVQRERREQNERMHEILNTFALAHTASRQQYRRICTNETHVQCKSREKHQLRVTGPKHLFFPSACIKTVYTWMCNNKNQMAFNACQKIFSVVCVCVCMSWCEPTHTAKAAML